MNAQSKRHSILEVLLNIFSGMLIAFTISQLAHIFQEDIQKYIWSGFIWELSAGSNIIMTVVLTAVSMVRSYVWRRFFNKIQLDAYKRSLHENSK